MIALRRHVWTAATMLVVALAMTTTAAAQGRGGGGRGGGGGGGLPNVETRSRLDIISDAMTLDKDQKKVVKDTLDAAYKGAAPIRAELKKTRGELAAAIQAGKPAAEIEVATKNYAVQVAAMAAAEMKALAQVLQPLRAEQRAQGTMSTFYLMRSMFLDDKKWDEIPEIREY